MSEEKKQDVVLEGGTYEILRKRLQEHGKDLASRLAELNKERKNVFGSIEPKLISTERITTDNNCIPRDIVALGDTFIFAYNVQFGLKSTTELADVFAVYELTGHTFEQTSLELFSNDQFISDFNNLYKYYKHTIFARFFVEGPHLYMIFRIGKSVTDIKAFKWLITPEKKLKYIDNRSDHEYVFPVQYEFQWTRATRDHFRDGRHPHISIEDRVFIECVGGDLTIKIEDNTEDGQGIYSEPVNDPEQKLDDAEIHYATVGPMILFKVKPYREEAYRYFIYNEKIHEAQRFDEIADSCVLLPDDQGLIFPNGFYLVSGDYKRFDFKLDKMLFERRIHSPNGEDTLFVFFNREHSNYLLLSYNLIDQSVKTPIQCQGYSFFHQGEMLYFKAESAPQKHHSVQIWQTPFVSPDYIPPVEQESFLYKIGNKELVRAMAESQNIVNLTQREDSYQSLYDDIFSLSVSALDSYFWINNQETQNLGEALSAVRDTASAAIDEFDKVRQIRKTTNDKITDVQKRTDKLLKGIKPDLMDRVDQFVGSLANLRTLRGEIISLRELRYSNTELIETLEERVIERSKSLSESCVEFLLKPDALDIYNEKVDGVAAKTDEMNRAVQAADIEQEITGISSEVETMIEVVGNLKIADATKSTQIIDGCSAIFTRLNTVRAELRNKKKKIQSVEAVAEFSSQLKLLDQSVVSFLDVADSPAKCDEYLNKLLVQLEELEGRFADFDDYVIQLSEKRAELMSAMESRKLALLEEKNKRASSLQGAADRILKAVAGRVEAFKTIPEINSFFAGDLMIDKIRGIVEKLLELDDSVKADEIQSRLKSSQESAVRQLKDRQELFVDGQNVIRFGKHSFSVNVQKTDLTVLNRDGKMMFHITGTNFFEEVDDPTFLETKSVWNQDFISENPTVYRAEFMAYRFLQQAGTANLPPAHELAELPDDELMKHLQLYISPRFDEGYTKGVHDVDGLKILRALLTLTKEADTLRYNPQARSLARLYYFSMLTNTDREQLDSLFKGIGGVLRNYKSTREFNLVVKRLEKALSAYLENVPLFEQSVVTTAALYLLEEVSLRDGFIISPEAARLHDEFLRYLREHKQLKALEETLSEIRQDHVGAMQLLRGWLTGFVGAAIEPFDTRFSDEVATLILTNTFAREFIHTTSVVKLVEGIKGNHPRVADGQLTIDLPEFLTRLEAYERTVVPVYKTYTERKKQIIAEYERTLKLNEFKPRVLTSFVRNKMINDYYLPIIGDNLAKQIGATGAEKRTDLMGMLLLISPPGYGKTTLMEYIASRLGVIFVKINGPAIGHAVTNIDPQEAPNAAAREEIQKLNLAFEMGDNIMIYLDDIQHCNPELLQKFISLCDGQRRIEGVWKGRSRTYDLRGKKVAVVMAGNPYTESGDKFQIPDMLANRADTYNLGDIIGDSQEAFELSYLENSLTSNKILNPLATKSQKDLYQLVKLARTGQRDGVELEGNYSASEINDYVSVLQKLLRIQQVILKVNQEYIRSAGQADEYRTEPAFKLQGSYRNMNKLAEKVVPIMNDEEVTRLIYGHYEGESQTLTNGAEANLLKFYELTNALTEEQQNRWNSIKESFQRNQRFSGMKSGDSMTQAVMQLGDLTHNVQAITKSLSPLGDAASSFTHSSPLFLERLEKSLQSLRAPQSAPLILPEKFQTEFSPESLRTLLAELNTLFRKSDARPEHTAPIAAPQTPQSMVEFSESSLNRLVEAISAITIKTELPTANDAMDKLSDPEAKARGEFLASGALRQCFSENGFNVKEHADRSFEIRRDQEEPIQLKVRNDRLVLRRKVEVPNLDSPQIIEKLLALNAEIQPVSFVLETGEQKEKLIYLMETRDGKNLTRSELNEVIRALEDAAKRCASFFAL
ncbi:MAG: DNA repair ATPase [Sumerlaeia bacterium]